MVYERGCEYAQTYYRDERIASRAISDPQYWHWFLLQWKRCDENMRGMCDIETLSEEDMRYYAYDKYHSIKELGNIKGETTQPVKPWAEIFKRATA